MQKNQLFPDNMTQLTSCYYSTVFMHKCEMLASSEVHFNIKNKYIRYLKSEVQVYDLLIFKN